MMGTKRKNYAMDEDSSGTVVETVVSTNIVQPPLKLRIKHQTIVQKLTIDIYEAKNLKEKLKILLSFTHHMKLSRMHGEECEILLRLLKDLVKKETDPLLRSKSIEIMAEICRIPTANRLQIVEDVLESLHKENNRIVISQIFKTLTVAASLISMKSDIVQKILKVAVKRLDDTHHDVRCLCLVLLSRICPNEPIKLSSSRLVDVMELFSEFSADQDPRVRAVVYQSLLTLHQRNRPLDINVYDKACQALNDDYVCVRLAAVKLVWVFSNIFPDRSIPHPYSKEEEIRLLDDAFIKICNMVNDSSMKVRAEAVGLLGSLHDVSFNVLEQTLDKKLMSHGKKAKSFTQRQVERFRGNDSSGGGGGQWSTGKTWGDKNPSHELLEEGIRLMNTGSCGVFVRALEDEYMEVRTAGVDSLCELANQNASFAFMATDFLVDMFNDEIESVRLNSIDSLKKLGEYTDLREDQLDTILECLNDFNQVVRNSVRDLLAHCTLSTQACLHASVLALLANLKKYPQDQDSIWSSMKELGLRHPYFVSSLVPDLLVTHPYYAVPEPNIDDPVHIAVTTLIYNATAKCPSIKSLLPAHALQHYDYYRESLPDLIPELPCMATRNGNAHEGLESNHMTSFFQSTVDRVYALMKKGTPSVNQTIKTCINDLQHVKRIHSCYAPEAEFLSIFLRCQQLLRKCRTDRAWSIPAAFATNECSSFQNDVKDLLKLSYKLEFMFSGVSSTNICTIKIFRILAHCLFVLLELRSISKLQQSRKIDLKLWEIFLHRLNSFKTFVNITLPPESDRFLPIFNLQEAVEENLSSLSALVQVIQKFFLTYPVELKLENRLRQASVRIIEPKNNLDNPLKFSAGLTLGVDVIASLENVKDISEIYIRVIYPDLTVQVHKPKLSEFKSLTVLRHQLACKILLSHHTWTEPCVVKVAVVQGYATDLKEELASTGGEASVPGMDRIIRLTGHFTKSYQGFLNLSETVHLYIQPKPVTR